MSWEKNETKYYWFEGANEEDSKHIINLDPGTYNIEIHGANGGDSVFGGSKNGGVGGFIKGELLVEQESEIEIWVGESGGNQDSDGYSGGWGRYKGGDGSGITLGGGGGSTEIIWKNNSLIGVAHGGGGAGRDAAGQFDGGGGARCGTSRNGDDAECDSSDINEPWGGDGGENDNGDDGGQDAGNGLIDTIETTGGRQDPPQVSDPPTSYDSYKHGWVKITYLGEIEILTGPFPTFRRPT